MKPSSRIGLLAFLLLLFGATNLFAQSSPSLETVRVAMPGKLVDYSALYVGAHQGFFSKEGLQPLFIVMSAGIHYPALLSGEIDYTTLITSTIRAAIAGMPVKALMMLNDQNPFFLLSQPEIRDVRQLKGKRIAVSAFGASTDTATRNVLKHFGLDPNRDSIILALGQTGLRFAALQSKSVEAAMLSPPHSFIAQRQGFNNLFWMGDLPGEVVPANGLATTLRKLKQEPDQVRRVLRAIVRSMGYLRDHREEARSIVLREFKSSDQEAISRAFDFIVKGMTRDGNFTDSWIQETIKDEGARLGNKTQVSASQVADLEILPRVLRELK
jgi:NitT/TauT family transport system substrate-binding protein